MFPLFMFRKDNFSSSPSSLTLLFSNFQLSCFYFKKNEAFTYYLSALLTFTGISRSFRLRSEKEREKKKKKTLKSYKNLQNVKDLLAGIVSKSYGILVVGTLYHTLCSYVKLVEVLK